jgi:hypothetical protein
MVVSGLKNGGIMGMPIPYPNVALLPTRPGEIAEPVPSLIMVRLFECNELQPTIPGSNSLPLKLPE